MKRILKLVLPVIFALSVLTGLVGRQISTKVTQDYQNPQPEFTGPDMIETVLYDETLGQLYVCYCDANYVNVYSESGEFRWAVGTPYIRGNQFCLMDGMLACYGGGEAYLYNAEDGSFLKTAGEEEMDLPYDSGATEEFPFDSFQVYDPAGNVLVDRPAWYRVFDFFVTWAIAMSAALCYGLLLFLDRVTEAWSARRTAKLTDRRARIYLAASIVLIALHLGYGLAIQFHELLHPLLILGIFPITVHFIVAGWTWLDRPARWDIPKEEYTITRFWRAANIASLIAMVILFVVAVITA